MKFLKGIWAGILRLEASEQQARSEAYDKAPGFHWAMLSLAFVLCIAAVFASIWVVDRMSSPGSVEVEVAYTVTPVECTPERPNCNHGLDWPKLIDAAQRGEIALPAANDE